MTEVAISDRRPGSLAGDIRSTIGLSWPLVVSNLAQIALPTTDVIMMGWLGAEALAAGALGANLYFAFMMFGLGLVTATAPMMARELGRNRHSVREVRRTVRQGLWSAALLCIPAWLLLWNAEAILILIGQEPDLAASAAGYVRTYMWGLLPFLGFIVLRSFVSALERPLAALVVAITGIGANALAVWALMFGKLGFPALGLPGAGIGTTFALVLMFAVFVIIIQTDRRFRRYHLFGRFWRADWARFRELWRLGVPIGATVLFEVSIFNAAVFMMGIIGESSLAAHSIAIQIASVSFMVPMGLGQAATVRVGRAYGAGDLDAVRRAGWAAFAVGVGFMACMAVVMLSAPQLLLGLFIDIGDPVNAEVLALGVSFLAFAGLFQIFDGAQAVAAGMLRGLQDTRVPMIFALIGYWGIGLPLGALFAFPLGLNGAGLWMGLLTALAVVAVLMTTRWTMRGRLGLLAAAGQ